MSAREDQISVQLSGIRDQPVRLVSPSVPVRLLQALMRCPMNLHRDERGTISILSVFAVLMLAMLLGMVMNLGREVNNKVQMQNAADAATYSGSVVMARGMNTLAFTNHLLCDVFALTAFMREARDRHSEPLVPEILAAWQQAGQVLSGAEFEKFRRLGPAIQQKIPDEQQMVTSYLAWATASSEAVLPMLEEVLSRQLIREYQNAVLDYTPGLAQIAANEAAIRHGLMRDGTISTQRGPLQARLMGASREALRMSAAMGAWNLQGLANALPEEAYLGAPGLPAIDPLEPAGQDSYVWPEGARNEARQERRELAFNYLSQWNNEAMPAFRMLGKMSQFSELWTGFTCGQLEQLLAENAEKNLPLLIMPGAAAASAASAGERNGFLEAGYTFMCVVYWKPSPGFGPRWFSPPVVGDNVAFAQGMMFIRQNRLIKVFHGGGGGGGGGAPPGIPIGGVPGEFVELPPLGEPQAPVPPSGGGGGGGGEITWTVVRESLPTHWDLWNQSWLVQLVPATHPALASALKFQPIFDFSGQPAQDVALPDFSGLTAEDLSVLSHH